MTGSIRDNYKRHPATTTPPPAGLRPPLALRARSHLVRAVPGSRRDRPFVQVKDARQIRTRAGLPRCIGLARSGSLSFSQAARFLSERQKARRLSLPFPGLRSAQLRVSARPGARASAGLRPSSTAPLRAFAGPIGPTPPGIGVWHSYCKPMPGGGMHK